MRLFTTIPALIFIFSSGTAQAQIFKTIGKDGTVNYTNTATATATPVKDTTAVPVAAATITARNQGNGEVLLE